MQLLIAMTKILSCGSESHVKKFFEYFEVFMTSSRTLTIGNKVGKKYPLPTVYEG